MREGGPMRVLLSVTLAASLSGNIGAIAQSLASSSANQANVAGQISNGSSSGVVPGNDGKSSLLKDAKSGCSVLAIDGVAADTVAWSGSCTKGIADGSGTLTLSNQGKFVEAITATFDKGALRDGQAKIKWADGSSYSGNAVGAHMDGAGVLTTAT